MNKASDRTNRLKGMFAGVDPEALAEQAAKEAKSTKRPMTTAPTKALQSNFANIEAENLRLKAELEKSQILELDPQKVQASIIQDRFEWSDEDPEFQSLLSSIDEEGQQLPILVRPHPNDSGSYQLAYGARRNRACRLLGRNVRAYVQDLSDEQLIIAQGLENNERKNLSFIEQALFAASLSTAGYSRKTVAKAVGITDETNVSKMVAITKRVPIEIVRLIGPAPKIGRNRWDAFSLLAENGQKKPAILEALRDLPSSSAWQGADTNRRFDLALRTAEKANKFRATKPKLVKTAIEKDGRSFGHLERTEKTLRLTVDVQKEPQFAAFLANKMDELLNEFRAQESSEKGEGM